jgi:hypothetical protein
VTVSNGCLLRTLIGTSHRTQRPSRRIRAFYIFAIITDAKHSKAIFRIAPTDLPLLVETSLKYTLFAYVARQRVNFCLCGTQPTCTTHANVDRNAKRPKHP